MLGGATAQSYGAVGLSKPAVDTALVAAMQELVASGAQADLVHVNSDSAPAVAKPFVDSSGSVSIPNAPIGFALDEQFEPAVFSQTNAVEDSELMSRYEVIESEFPAQLGFGVVQNVAAGDVDVPTEGSPTNTGSSLLSFIEQVIAQAQASQQEFNSSLDGGRQGFIRESIDDVASGVGDALRTTLQDNVAGRGRELVADGIDLTGLSVLNTVAEPLLNTDYYVESAAVINGTLNLVIAPIGSFNLPPLGPVIANPQDEIASFAS